MARAYSGVLGSLALCLVIARGLVLGLPPNDCLTQSLAVFVVFAVIGFCIGYMADRTVCESVENRFREEMASLHAATASKSDEISAQ